MALHSSDVGQANFRRDRDEVVDYLENRDPAGGTCVGERHGTDGECAIGGRADNEGRRPLGLQREVRHRLVDHHLPGDPGSHGGRRGRIQGDGDRKDPGWGRFLGGRGLCGPLEPPVGNAVPEPAAALSNAAPTARVPACTGPAIVQVGRRRIRPRRKQGADQLLLSHARLGQADHARRGVRRHPDRRDHHPGRFHPVPQRDKLQLHATGTHRRCAERCASGVRHNTSRPATSRTWRFPCSTHRTSSRAFTPGKP